MKKKKYPKLEDYALSDYIELKGDILYKINGGKRIENSNAAVAQAQVGDVLERKDGTVVKITQGDIDWAKEYVGSNGGGTEGSADGGSGAEEVKLMAGNSSVGTGSNSGSNGNSGSSNYSSSNNSSKSSVSTTSSPSTSNSSSSTSYTPVLTHQQQYEMAKADEENHANINTSSANKNMGASETFIFDLQNPSNIIADLDNRKSLLQAAELLSDPNLGYKVTARSESGTVKVFKNYSEINDYLMQDYYTDFYSLKTLSKNIKANSTYIENNQEKTDRSLFWETTRTKNGFSSAFGLSRNSSKTLNKGPKAQLDIDVLTASIDWQISKEYTHIGFGINGLNASGNLGGSTDERSLTFGSSIGVGTGIDFEFKRSEGHLDSFSFDLGFLANFRVNYEKKK